MNTENPTVNTEFTPDVPAADAPAAVSVSADGKHHNYVAEGFKNRTRGEAVFNLGTYFGVGYLGVTAASVVMSWALRDFKPGAKMFSRGSELFINATKGHRTGEALEKYQRTVDSNKTILALFLGGSIMSVLPIKWLEDNKAGIVKKLDQWLYGREKFDSDSTISQAHEDLASAPKQTWNSVAASRLLAFGATFGTSLLLGSNTSPLGKHGLAIDKYSTKAGRWLDGAINHKDRTAIEHINQARAISPHEIVREGMAIDRTSSKVFSYITLDAFYTLITSGALYVFTRVLAPVFDKQLRERDRQPLPDAAHPAPQPTATDELTQPEVEERPQPQVQLAQMEGRLAHAPEQAASLA